MHQRDDQQYTDEQLTIFQHGYRKGRDITLAWGGVVVLIALILYIAFASYGHHVRQQEREHQELLDKYDLR